MYYLLFSKSDMQNNMKNLIVFFSSSFFLFSFFFFLLSSSFFAQDSSGIRRHIDTLCSPFMHGRGYVNNGDKIAAEYISSEFKKYGVKSFLFETYQQPFPVAINTFPGKISLAMGDSVLTPGKDFLVLPYSGSIKKKSFKVLRFDKETNVELFRQQDVSDFFILIDKLGIEDTARLRLFEEMSFNPLKAKGIITVKEDKLTHSLSSTALDFPAVEILRSSLPVEFKKISIELESRFFEKYFTQNVAGYIEGTQFLDSFIVFSAHYDHLGRMGNGCYFPGSNDNASGTAMLLRLAEYYSRNPQKFSVAFIAFGAEEAGLVGSKYFTLHPMFPLEKIRFLVNLDILGTGDEGITVVNATGRPEEFEMLKKINAERNLLSEIKERGQARNSDHYYFSEKEVPAFFIYTLGGIKAYHDIYDRPETLPLNESEDIFRLLTEFATLLQK